MGLGTSKYTDPDDLRVNSVDDLNAKLEEAKLSCRPVVIEFTTSWCGPCKKMAPVFREFAREFAIVKFISIDVDEFKDIANDYKVESMPTFILLRNGKEVGKIVGANPDELHRMITQLIKDD